MFANLMLHNICLLAVCRVRALVQKTSISVEKTTQVLAVTSKATNGATSGINSDLNHSIILRASSSRGCPFL